MESYFSKFHKNIIGQNQTIKTPFHDSIRILYADWTASGRMYGPIEKRIVDELLPFVANTHTDTNDTGSTMTYAYHKAQHIIKDHVGANEEDVLISSNSGMTGVVNKFQRILGLKIHENFQSQIKIAEEDKPIIFITHMEHHSNQTTWLETLAEVVIIPPDKNGLVSPQNFKELLNKYQNRKTKIASISACSNVTGIEIPYQEIADIIHRHGGKCFVDFACSAPYVSINMHKSKSQYLDAVFLSPHKFLGGPGSTGILVFNQNLYTNKIPDEPGGGTVDWTNPWGQHKYLDNIEAREDGGTPAFLQTIKAAMCMQLKNEMGVENIQKREEEILEIIWENLSNVSNIHILADQHRNRLGVVSFYIDDLHYNLGVKMLNDKFGIQTRGGCSCAGTYGHYLLNVTPETSANITTMIDHGNCSLKPGWIRMSIHPTHTDDEVKYMCDSIKELALHFKSWSNDYNVNLAKGSIKPKDLKTVTELENRIDNFYRNSFT